MIKNVIQQITQGVGKYRLFVLEGIIGLSFVLLYAFRGDAELPANTVAVMRGDVVQEVSITGRVKPSQLVELGFERGGRVVNIEVGVGNHVAQGALIAEIDTSGAEASLAEAEARLAELMRGPRSEELALKRAELAKYEQDLANAYSGVADVVRDAFNKTDEAIHTQTTGIFTGTQTSSYAFTYQVCNNQLEVDGIRLKTTEDQDFDQWGQEIARFPANPSHEETAEFLSRANVHVSPARAYLETVNKTLTLDCTLTNSSLDGYRTNIGLARTSLSSALTAINTKQQSIASLALTLATAKNDLSLLEAGTASEVLTAQRARVLAARGELRKHRIYAPISGTVTRVDVKEGEYASPSVPLFGLSADTAFEIEAYIPEADIAKVSTGDQAQITLDAYGSDSVFLGVVASIDPAETVIDNVSTYRTILNFSEADARIKSGMTANIDIGTATAKNVLYVPQRAIKTENGTKFVRVVGSDGALADTVVEVGLRGSDGSVEILSGVSEGDLILGSPIR